MKSILLGLIFAFAVLPVLAVEKDTVPEWGTPAWKAYSKEDQDAKSAKDGTVAGFLKAADLTPFNWVAAWHEFNAAKLTWTSDPDKAEEYLKKAEAFMAAAKVNVPKEGPNTPEKLKTAIASIRKAMEDAEKGGGK